MVFRIYGLDVTSFYPYTNYIQCDEDVDIYVDTREYVENSNKKIYIQSEPYGIYDCRSYLREYSHRFDYILCHDASLYENPAKFISYIPASCWLNPNAYNSIDTTLKQFKISSLTGHKSQTDGHKARLVLYGNQLSFEQYPITFYRSHVQPQVPAIQNNPFIEISKLELFTTYQFSIVIENVREMNGFTEKLIDCLITKTIPLYYGCPNVSTYFNTDGWILLTDDDIVSDLHAKLPALHADYYKKYAHVIEENYEKAKQYSSYTKCVLRGLEKIPFLRQLEYKDSPFFVTFHSVTVTYQ